MRNNSSNDGRLKGVYVRGKKFWYRYSYEGRQHRIPLETEDEGIAVTKALKIRQDPLLSGIEPIKDEIKAYLDEKQEDRTYTRNSADSRMSVLNMFISDRHLQEVREISESEIRVWLKSLRKRTKRPPLRNKTKTRAKNAEQLDTTGAKQPAPKKPKNWRHRLLKATQ